MAKKSTKTKTAAPAPRFVFPAGFTPHHGDGCPVDGEQYVEPIIRTADGFGSGGVSRANLHDWTFEAHEREGGLGEVIAYRLADKRELAKFSPEERF